jgi:hypothetical protein
VRWLLLALAPCLAAQSAPSQRVAAAFTYLQRMAAKIENQKIHDATVDALKPDTCIAHRAGLTADEKAQILKSLKAEGFLSDGDSMAGVFPPVRDDGSACPKLPQPFTNAPGSNFGGHHSYPGGLAIHESFNLTAAPRASCAISKTLSARPRRRALRHRPHALGHARPSHRRKRPSAPRLHRRHRRRSQRHRRELPAS